jgi:hypothetical protein
MDSIRVKVGQHIEPGGLLGLSGSTGHSTGPHLHFSLLHGGHYADPSHLTAALQHYSGEIAGPSFLGITGPASWVVKHAQKAGEHALHSFSQKVLDVLYEIGLACVELSYSICLIGCASLIILGALGHKNGYRWAGLTFGIYTLIRWLGK